jgi:anti-anti-sigma regulatory factor
MLKISTVESGNHSVILRLEGRLLGPWVEALRGACEQTLDAGLPLTLDVDDVSFVDRDGVELLAGLRARRVRFIHCTPFLREQLRAAERPTPATPGRTAV